MESKPDRSADESRPGRGDDTSSLSAVTDHLTETAETLKQEATTTAATVKQAAVNAGERQMDYAADRIGQFAKAVHGAADELGSQLPEAAGYIHDAAAGLERASSTLQQSSVEDALATFNKFAREQPALFFGGAILAGISLSRFLKSSGSGHRR